MGHGTLWGYVPCFHCLCRIHSDSTLPSRARKKNYHQEGLRPFRRFSRGVPSVPGFGKVGRRTRMLLEGVREGEIERRWKRGEAQKLSRVPIWGFFSCVRGGRGDAQGDPREGYFFCPPSVGFFCPGFLWGRYLWLWCLLVSQEHSTSSTEIFAYRRNELSRNTPNCSRHRVKLTSFGFF
jgi:hypothetical protein